MEGTLPVGARLIITASDGTSVAWFETEDGREGYLSIDVYKRQNEELADYARTRPARLLEFFQESMHLSDDQMRHYFGGAGAAIRAYQNR